MSICTLRSFNRKLFYQAFILARTRKILPLPGTTFARNKSSNDSHHQMGESTKNINQNTQVLNAKGCQDKKLGESEYENIKSTSRDSEGIGSCGIKGPDPCGSKKSETTEDPCDKIKATSGGGKDDGGKGDGGKGDDGKVGSCKGGGADGGGDGKGGGGKGGLAPDDKNKNRSRNLALLAAAILGAGGLLLWLFLRGKKKSDDECVPIAEITDGGYQTVPSSSGDLPNHVPYILIGGGTASFSAFRAIKSNDPKAKVLMITNEFRKPYMRPPLSKELWYSAQSREINKDYRFKQWTGSERSLFFEPDEFFIHPTKLMESINGGIAVAQGFTVKKIDPANHIITLTDGYEIGYDECLIATGCMPKNLGLFTNAVPSVKEKVMVYRTPDDFERLKRYADEKKSITIIGNGFIGSELACSLANYSKDRGVRIYQVFQESGNMSKVLPEYLSKWTTCKMKNLGVYVITNASIKEAQREKSKLKLTLTNGDILLTDIAVVSVGCEPNTKMASLSGLETDHSHGGFVVNAELEARTNLFVAGDASCFYDPLLGRRRVEHHDHSVVSGRLAGENMVGKKKAYAHQSMFWSDLGPEIGYEGIGLVDASLPTVGVFALPSTPNRSTDNLSESRTDEEQSSLEQGKIIPDLNCNNDDTDNYGRGVIFYLKNDKIVGILLWNLFNRIGLARTIINQNKKYDDLNEVAKLFEIHS